MEPAAPTGQPPGGPSGPPPAGAVAGGVDRLRGARSELRRQLREQRRVRAVAMAMVVMLVLGAPMIYFGILFAARDPVLISLDRLQVPGWAAQSAEDRIISGSRWCFIDCRFRERTLISERETAETTEAYQAALIEAGWTPWQVEGCPQVAVDGDYSCWTRDEYTLDLWVRPPDCAYDPRNLRPDPEAGGAEDSEDSEDSEAGGSGGQADDAEDADDADDADEPEDALGGGEDDCGGSVVEIKMQNRVADERGLRGPGGEPPAPGGEFPEPTVPPSPTSAPEDAEGP